MTDEGGRMKKEVTEINWFFYVSIQQTNAKP